MAKEIDSKQRMAALMLVVGGVLLVVAAMSPWLTARTGFDSPQSINGLDEGRDGIIVLVLGIIAALLGTAELMSIKVPSAVRDLVWFVGLGALILAFKDHDEMRLRIEGVPRDLAVLQVGAGIWLLFLGAGLLFAAGVFLLQRGRAAEEAEPVLTPVG